ncbi:DUF3566 domain-containing protein [Antrihabitans stalactiti]|uniref:DUF3566 domain-containing protein n=1 Tax=Antrihabitans stalactiti TaxID=2584121 RepID=A0A848KHC0_9NOCA|nr:DUF3566 domain-containing protein [Antrihabitans stalactiti]NMN95317.1 DUF3566 domain-containing protein [Antrihabitans stalactiti]
MSTPEDPQKPNNSGQSSADRAKDAVTDRVRQPPPLQPRPLPRPIPSVPAAAKPATPPAQGQTVGENTVAMPQVAPAAAEQTAPHHQVDESRPSQVRAPQTGQPHPPQHQGPRTQGARPVQQPPAAKAPDAADASKSADGAPTTVQNGHPRGAGAPPWQRGNQPPQREPQSNLNRPGEPPVVGRPPAPANREAAVADAAEAAKAQRKEAVQAKSAAIDGPTRNIPRPELAKDMPDLSEVRHPLPAEASTSSPQAAAVATAAPAEGAPLRATVQIRKIDPWSTLKVSLVISVALFFVWMVAVGLLYVVLDGMGVWDRLNNAFTEIVTESGSDGLVTSGQIFGYAAGIGLINVVLFTALATIGSFIYNQCSDLVGGIEVTLADPD